MTIYDIYEQLSFGELWELFLGSGGIDASESAGMPEENFRKLLPGIQLGLNALHKRFLLREGTLNVELQSGKVSYLLTTRYAESNTRSQEPVKYIRDAASPFQDDLMKVERVYGTYLEQEFEIPLNVIDDPSAIRTPAMNALIVPDDAELAPWLSETSRLRVVYWADHPKIQTSLANAAPLVTEISLPATHLEPLLYFVASRAYNPMGMDPGAMHEGNNYFAKYEAACQQLENWGFGIDSDSGRDRVTAGGWA
jgi:hypothetical protein